jgi:hypothetical protein
MSDIRGVVAGCHGFNTRLARPIARFFKWALLYEVGLNPITIGRTEA